MRYDKSMSDTPPQKPERLTEFSSPQRQDMRNSKRVRIVRFLRTALPLLAVALTVGTLSWTVTSTDDTPTRETAEERKPMRIISRNELLNPRFDSVDDQGRPYTLVADRAVRGETDAGLIILTVPNGRIMLTAERTIKARAQKGTYHQDGGRLSLQDNVQLSDSQGYVLDTQSMNVDLSAQTVLTDDEVTGKGPAGTLNATGMFGDAKVGILQFKGPARLSLVLEENGLGGLK